MRNLRDRLDRLEQTVDARTQFAQCATCRDWPPARVRTLNVDGSVTDETPDVPERCPSCGWAPVLVIFEIVEDWRSVTR